MVDSVLVDAAAVPIIVVTKPSDSPEIRREVLGQIVEYGAAPREPWSQGNLRVEAASYWHDGTESLHDVLSPILDAEADLTKFWDKVAQNLRIGRMRPVIAGDALPVALRRAIEMINDQMTTTELLGLERASYGTDDEGLVLAPRVIGQSQRVIDRREPVSKVWTEPLLRRAYQEMEDRDLAQKLSQILDWAHNERIFLRDLIPGAGFCLSGFDGKRLGSGGYVRRGFGLRLRTLGKYCCDFSLLPLKSERNHNRPFGVND